MATPLDDAEALRQRVEQSRQRALALRAAKLREQCNVALQERRAMGVGARPRLDGFLFDQRSSEEEDDESIICLRILMPHPEPAHLADVLKH
eukprot:2570349-Prymnesium_polylepis.1